MNREEIQEKVNGILVDSICCEKECVKNDANFKEDLGMDSLDVMQAVMESEREFDITFSDNEVNSLVTVEDLVNQIELKVVAK